MGGLAIVPRARAVVISVFYAALNACCHFGERQLLNHPVADPVIVQEDSRRLGRYLEYPSSRVRAARPYSGHREVFASHPKVLGARLIACV